MWIECSCLPDPLRRVVHDAVRGDDDLGREQPVAAAHPAGPEDLARGRRPALAPHHQGGDQDQDEGDDGDDGERDGIHRWLPLESYRLPPGGGRGTGAGAQAARLPA